MTSAFATNKANSLQEQHVALIQLLAVIFAFWPVWMWFYERTTDRADEPLGMVALITVLLLTWNRSFKLFNQSSSSDGTANISGAGRAENQQPSMVSVTALVIGYCLLLPIAPKAFLGLIAASALFVCLRRAKLVSGLSAGDCILIGLSVPIVAALNFYAGYPLRVVSCHIASLLLNLGGTGTHVAAGQIVSSNFVVAIDEPCSGIKMLWASLFLAATYASLHRLNLLRTSLLLALSVVLAVIANAIRISSLFYLEAGRIDVGTQLHGLIHAGLGLISFTAAALVGYVVVRLYFDSSSLDSSIFGSSITFPRQIPHKQSLGLAISFVVACLCAATIPFFSSHSARSAITQRFPGWPTQFEGKNLTPVPLSASNERYAASFPGKTAVFATEQKRVVYRWLTEPTRQLHSAASCYRAGDYQIKWLPEYIDSKANRWSAFEATRANERLLVHERIADNVGMNWVDVSSWYWSALLNKTRGPWWITTVSERLP